MVKTLNYQVNFNAISGCCESGYGEHPGSPDVLENTAGFYFLYPYNARLAVVDMAFVHRYLTYLSRVCKSRLSIKTQMSFWDLGVSG